ncbi:MAG: hypothetical protein ACO1QR_15180 [Chthoniobacteraceae bacterium]
MATISTEGGVFTLGYEALAPDGKPGHFQSCFSPEGAVIFERKQDMRPRSEIYMERMRRRRLEPPSETRAGIYRTRALPNLLAFIDKLDTEEGIFLNWRRAPSCGYARISIGLPYFYTSSPEPWPLVSEILFHEGVLAVAWVRPTGTAHELVFSKIHVDAQPTVETRSWYRSCRS